MTAADEVTWRVEFLIQHCPAPSYVTEDEIYASTHAIAVGLIDMGGARQADNARAVIAGVVAGWPEGSRPTASIIDKEAVWVARTPTVKNNAPNGSCDALASRIEDAIAGRLVSVAWPWPSVSNLTRALMPGSITVVVGNPGASKSFLLLQAALYWLQESVPVALYELEENVAFWLGRALAQLAKCGALTDPEWIAGHPAAARQALHDNGPALRRLSGCLETAPAQGITLEGLAQWVEKQAQEGTRIIMADPLTAAMESGSKPWESAQKFMLRAKRAAVEHGASLLFTTHGKKRDAASKGPPDLDSLAGGSAYSRFASCVLWLEALPELTDDICMDALGRETTHQLNRRLRILKAREGRGTGLSLGCEFQSESLTMIEHGVVVKRDKPQKADASHQSARLKQKPCASEDLFNTEASRDNS